MQVSFRSWVVVTSFSDTGCRLHFAQLGKSRATELIIVELSGGNNQGKHITDCDVCLTKLLWRIGSVIIGSNTQKDTCDAYQRRWRH